MKALIKQNKKEKNTELKDILVPSIGPDDVLVQVKYAGICGSDIEIYYKNLDEISYSINEPLTLGHEFSGVITKIGSNIENFKVGDQVVAETHAEYCGTCVMCKNNNYHVCKERQGFGFGVDGAFADYVKVPKRILHKIPKGVSLEEAALTEPLCVAYSVTVEKMSISPSDSVLIIGPGSIGLLCCKLAKLRGAGEVIVVGTEGDEQRLKIAKEFGADRVINNTEEDPYKLSKDYNDGYGVDAVIDAAGPSETLNLALNSVKPTGLINKVAWGPKPLNYSIDKIIEKDLTLRGSFSHTWPTWNKCLQLLSRKQINLSKITTKIVDLNDWESGFELVKSKEAIKVLIAPNN